jgi:tetratricopeptide (TPR) repeat protein
MKHRAIAGIVLCAFLATGFATVWRLQKNIDEQREAMSLERQDVLLWPGSVVKKLSLEYAPLAGAIYWTRAVQYYGESHRLSRGKLELLWPLLDIATTLDPHLIVAYRFGSTFLSEPFPAGAGRPDLAIKLLERGLKENPDNWRFYQDMGNVYYFDMKNYPQASEAFAEGSKNPHAHIWMKVMAAKIAAEGESLETSFFLWRDIYQTTADKAVKDNAEKHLKIVKAQMDLRELNRLGDEYEKQRKQRPARLSDLQQAGIMNVTPVDPEGFPYVFGTDGKAQVNPKSGLVKEKEFQKKEEVKK